MAIVQLKIYIQGEQFHLRLDEVNIQYIARAYPSKDGNTTQAFNTYLSQFKEDNLPVTTDWLRHVLKHRLTKVTGYKSLSTSLNMLITAERIRKEVLTK